MYRIGVLLIIFAARVKLSSPTCARSQPYFDYARFDFTGRNSSTIIRIIDFDTALR